MYGGGFMIGWGDGNFHPKAEITRVEVGTVMYRILGVLTI